MAVKAKMQNYTFLYNYWVYLFRFYPIHEPEISMSLLSRCSHFNLFSKCSHLKLFFCEKVSKYHIAHWTTSFLQIQFISFHLDSYVDLRGDEMTKNIEVFARTIAEYIKTNGEITYGMKFDLMNMIYKE
jgi:hypothetical protein